MDNKTILFFSFFFGEICHHLAERQNKPVAVFWTQKLASTKLAEVLSDDTRMEDLYLKYKLGFKQIPSFHFSRSLHCISGCVNTRSEIH